MQIVITLNSYEELEELRDVLSRLGKKGTPMTDEEKAQMRKFYEMYPPDPCPEDTPKKEEKPKKAAPKKAEPAPESVTDPEPEPTPTAEDKPKAEANESDVKVLLAGKIKAGKKAEVRALFEEYGVTKLSELTAKYPEKLAEFAEKAEAL